MLGYRLWLHFSMVMLSLNIHSLSAAAIFYNKRLKIKLYNNVVVDQGSSKRLKKKIDAEQTVAFLMAVSTSMVVRPPRGSTDSSVRPNVSWKM